MKQSVSSRIVRGYLTAWAKHGHSLPWQNGIALQYWEKYKSLPVSKTRLLLELAALTFGLKMVGNVARICGILGEPKLSVVSIEPGSFVKPADGLVPVVLPILKLPTENG